MSATRLNLAANYLNFATAALVGLVVNPLLASALGATGFGAWKACQRVFDVAAPPDGSSSQALKWTVAHASDVASPALMQRMVGAAVAVWVLWLPILALISLAVVFALPSLVNGLSLSEDQLLRQAGIVLSANILLAGLLSVPAAVLIGVNKGYLAMGLATVSLLLTNVGVLVVAEFGYGLIGIAGVVVGVAVLGALCTWVAARNSVDWWGVQRPTRSEVAALARFGGWILVWSYVQRLLLSTELILVGFLMGAAAVSQYTFTSYAAQFALAVCGLTTSAFMPRLAAAVGKGDRDGVHTLTKETHEINLSFVAVLGAGMLAFNNAFVTVWAGDQFYMGDSINVLIVVAFVQLALIRWNAQIQDSGLNIRGKALVGAVGGLASVVLAGTAYTMTNSLEWTFVAMIAGRMVLSIGFPLLSRQTALLERISMLAPARRYGCALGILGIGHALSLVFETMDALTLLVSGLASGTVFTLLAYFGVLSAETRGKVWLAIAGARHRSPK